MRSEARQRQILDCAKQVFAERGFHDSNISHICKAAGIGRGTLYQYFANKKAVFTAILGETLDRVRHMMLRRRGSYTFPPPEQLSRAGSIQWSARRMHEILSVVFEDERTLRILLREAAGRDVDVETLVNEIDDGLITIVEEDLASSQTLGIVRNDLDPRLTATLMVGGVEKLALAALRGDDPIDLQALSMAVAKLHCSGVLSDRVSDGGSDGKH
jgi:AcrR family transcriptional regulator